jgi:hypothetical protein
MADNNNVGVGSNVGGGGVSALSNTSVTWANIPAAGTAGRTIFVSNAGTKGSFWYDDGTRWKPMNGQCLLASLDSASANIGSTSTIVMQATIPAGMWQTGDIIRVQGFMEKSGATDTGITVISCGTSGTTSDTGLISATWMAATSRTTDYFNDFRLESATSSQLVSIAPGYGATTSVLASPVTISSAATNTLYISWGIRSSGATDTVSGRAGSVWLISKAN